MVSTTILPASDATRMLLRRRLSFGFFEAHTSQGQAITGTPWDVPVPKNVIWMLLTTYSVAGFSSAFSVAAAFSASAIALLSSTCWYSFCDSALIKSGST
ncbi:hypothetical protein MKQ70_31340 [Chitinophaga sedimenti]|uniref:hypothetical protein n=1 Tax=Chitinophaga sedimenti TaxID=2033606 RepID=UPI002003117D|nr:hypothetical protein [Chitinophaga sedimenti]MCK7559223.1 hypothetical protein [Chitinophaga sedimenti]